MLLGSLGLGITFSAFTLFAVLKFLIDNIY